MAFAVISSQAQSIFAEQGKLIRAPQAVTSLGSDLFGDQVNLYTGALEFTQIDVSLPGNNALPVSAGRHLTAVGYTATDGLFGKWELEIPHLHGLFAKNGGWTVNAGGTPSNQRCTLFGKPSTVSGSPGSMWNAAEYWHGSFLYVPGAGDREIFKRKSANTNFPSDGQSYPLVASDNWAFRCLATLASGGTLNDGGEGFIAIPNVPKITVITTQQVVKTITKTAKTSKALKPAAPPPPPPPPPIPPPV